MYTWREAERRGLRRVQLENNIAETKIVSSNAFTTDGILAGRVVPGSISAISVQLLKNRDWRYW